MLSWLQSSAHWRRKFSSTYREPPFLCLSSGPAQQTTCKAVRCLYSSSSTPRCASNLCKCACSRHPWWFPWLFNDVRLPFERRFVPTCPTCILLGREKTLWEQWTTDVDSFHTEVRDTCWSCCARAAKRIVVLRRALVAGRIPKCR